MYTPFRETKYFSIHFALLLLCLGLCISSINYQLPIINYQLYKLSGEQIQGVIDRASTALFEYCREHNIHYVVTGVSGGLDSAVTLGLAAEAVKQARKNNFALHNVGLLLPCHTDPDHTLRGRECIAAFEAQELEIPLNDVFDQIAKQSLPDTRSQIENLLRETGGVIPTEHDYAVAHGNIRCRLRMMLGTYHAAKLLKGMVLSTDNYSEYFMGFWTLCGDVGDFAMIQKIFKGLELYDIAKALSVPDSVIQAIPDDGLGITSGGDEAQLGATYETIDRVMIHLLQNNFDPNASPAVQKTVPEFSEIDLQLMQNIWERAQRMAYKRRGTVILERSDLGLPALQDIKL